MRTKSLLLSFACLLAIPGVYAQRDADVTVAYQQDIENILLDPLSGQIIVKEKDKVSCYNPETNKTEWEVTKAEIGEASSITNAQNTLDALASPDLLKIFETNESVELIPNSPFVRVILADKDAIISIADGKIVFNSAKTNYRITRTEFLFEENALLFIATDGKVFNCVWYDLNEGKEKWIAKLSDVAGFASQFAASFLQKESAVDKVAIAKDAIYTSINGNLYKLAKADGTINWATDFKINQ
ncbi:MAG: PQQ-like beta-propeller repeat protein, partial [Prevotellaceae bacterium]|nr:PQQ-like beta-propeller repeat protein [Prevotellaceae bacterium]